MLFIKSHICETQLLSQSAPFVAGISHASIFMYWVVCGHIYTYGLLKLCVYSKQGKSTLPLKNTYIYYILYINIYFIYIYKNITTMPVFESQRDLKTKKRVQCLHRELHPEVQINFKDFHWKSGNDAYSFLNHLYYLCKDKNYLYIFILFRYS